MSFTISFSFRPWMLGLPLLLSLLACQRDLDVPLPEHTSRIVVNAYLNAGQAPEVYVTRSHALLEDLEKISLFLPDAVVELYQEGALLGQLSYRDTLITSWGVNGDSLVKPTGKFTSEEIEIQGGATYELRISHPDYEDITATTFVPQPVEILQAELKQNVARTTDIGGFSASQSLLSLQIKDLPGQAEYYQARLILEFENPWLPGEFIEEQLWESLYIAQEQNEQGSYEIGPVWMSDEGQDGESIQVDFVTYLPNAYDGQTPTPDLNIRSFTVQLYVANEATYEYLSDYQRQLENTSGGFSLFPSESIVVFNNIEGGYGIFGGLTEASTRFE